MTLSRPPSALATATSSSAVPWGSSPRASDLGDVVVADLVDEPVAAHEEAVAAHERQRPGVDPHARVDAEGPGDDVAARVGAGLVVGDVAGRHELLDVAVVDGDPAQPAVPEEVGPRVADVDERPLADRAGVVAGPVPGPPARRRPRDRRPASVSARTGASASPPSSTMPVTVVPIPCWSGLAFAARKIVARWRRRRRRRRRRGRRPARLSRSRRRSTASWAATSPARWPPMPSATMNTPSSASDVVLVVGRMRPGSVVRTPATARPLLRLQHRVADLDAVAGVQQLGAVQPVAVVERAVRRAEVLDHRLAVDDVDLAWCCEMYVSSSMRIVDPGSRPIVMSPPTAYAVPRRALGSMTTRRATVPRAALGRLAVARRLRRRRPSRRTRRAGRRRRWAAGRCGAPRTTPPTARARRRGTAGPGGRASGCRVLGRRCPCEAASAGRALRGLEPDVGGAEAQDVAVDERLLGADARAVDHRAVGRAEVDDDVATRARGAPRRGGG